MSTTKITAVFFLRVRLIINQNWFRQRLGTGQTPSHYLSQLWSSSVVHKCVTRTHCVGDFTAPGKRIDNIRRKTVMLEHEGYVHPHSCKVGNSNPSDRVGLRDGLTIFCKIPTGRYTQKCPWGDARLVAYCGYPGMCPRGARHTYGHRTYVWSHLGYGSDYNQVPL